MNPRPAPRGDRWFVALALLACAVYLAVALTSPGYDDEFYNIGRIEQAPSLIALIRTIERIDAHPPGQYLLNALMFRITGSWPLVRAAGALVMALTVYRFAECWRIADRKAMLVHFVLVVLHPSLLMWCTGLRWFTYFVPLFLLAVLLLRRAPERGSWFWPALAALGLGMFYLNYLAVLLVPLLVAVASWQRRDRLRAEWPVATASAGVAAVLAVPQLWAFLIYQRHHFAGQHSGPIASLLGIVQGLPVHAGVFPLSIAGLATLLVFAALVALILWRRRASLLQDPEIVIAVAGTLLILLAGLAGKGRNLTPLVPLVFGQFVPLAWDARDRISRGLVLLLAASNLWGCINVLRHWDTGKGSWNMPVAQALAAADRIAARCPGPPAFFVTDPVLAGNLVGRHRLVVGQKHEPVAPAAGRYCLIELRTGHGWIPPELYRRLLEWMPPTPAPVARLGPDPYARFKRLGDPAIPDDYVELYDHGQVDAAGIEAFERSRLARLLR